jgi:hypothetical protein
MDKSVDEIDTLETVHEIYARQTLSGKTA